MALHHIDNKMALLEGSEGHAGLTEGDAMSFEGSDDGILDLKDLTEGHILFDKMKLRSRGVRQERQDSIMANIQDSWGTDGIVCELPSELMECKSEDKSNLLEMPISRQFGGKFDSFSLL
jgi:hypothetical protein